jgi:hypothetical protein
MACPLFLPVSPLGDFAGDGVPLGDVYGGECAAGSGTLIPIGILRRCCNFGYARDACAHAGTIDADASRFLVKSDCGGVVEIAWSTERNHHPVAVGILRVEQAAAPDPGPIDRQARAYATSYLRRMGRA